MARPAADGRPPTDSMGLEERAELLRGVMGDLSLAAAKFVPRARIEDTARRWLAGGQIRGDEERADGAIGDAFTLGRPLTLAPLKIGGHELHALTNWSVETFPSARVRFPFLDRFKTILVSGEVGLKKTDRRIFQLLLERIGHPAEACLFIDDSARNVAAARALGFDVIPFHGAQPLRDALHQRRITTETLY